MVNKQLKYSHRSIYHKGKATRQYILVSLRKYFYSKSHADETGRLVPAFFLFFQKALSEVKGSGLQFSFNVFRLLLNWAYNKNKLQKQPLEVFCKKGVLRNFVKFTEKHLRQSLFFNKVAGLRPATLLKKRLWHRCFPVSFVKFLRTPFLAEHLRRLLLKLDKTLDYPEICSILIFQNRVWEQFLYHILYMIFQLYSIN